MAWDARVDQAEVDPTYACPAESEVLGSSGGSVGSTTIGIGLIAGASEKE